MTINKIREELFGCLKEPKKTRATGDHKVDVEIIKNLWAPIEGDETIMYFFCSGCGNIVSVTPVSLRCLLGMLGEKFRESPKSIISEVADAASATARMKKIDCCPFRK